MNDPQTVAIGYAIAFAAGVYAAKHIFPSSTSASSSPGGNGGIRNDYGWSDGPGKMVLVVNMELKMGKGKIAAQVGHAVLGAYKKCEQSAPSAIRWWEQLGQAKICVQCPTQAEMEEIATRAKAKGLVTYQVTDAGRTQIAAGSRTVLAIGPSPEVQFKGLTDHLKLL